MQNDPVFLLLVGGVSLYVAKIWWDDLRSAQKGTLNPRALPGATPSAWLPVIIAATGGFALVAAETWGENALGVAAEQSKITALFAAYTLLAAIVEEIIFRGFIVIENRGSRWLWLSAIGASVLFALLHPFLWDWSGGMPWNGGNLSLHFTTKGAFSTLAVFVSSLWFYTVRFFPLNRSRSLLPCFAAHGAKNLGVIAVKCYLGYTAGWW
jgi:membrane protease YdiL (CAAX protease family)